MDYKPLSMPKNGKFPKIFSSKGPLYPSAAGSGWVAIWAAAALLIWLFVFIDDDTNLRGCKLDAGFGKAFLDGAISVTADDELPTRLRHEFGADNQTVIVDLDDTL